MRIKLLYLKKYRKMWHQKFEKNGKPRFIYNSELRKEIGGVCVRVRWTHNCLVHSKPWMQQPRLILTRDLVVIVVFQTTYWEVHYHYLLVLVMNLTQTSMHLGAHRPSETRQHFKSINQQSVTGGRLICVENKKSVPHTHKAFSFRDITLFFVFFYATWFHTKFQRWAA